MLVTKEWFSPVSKKVTWDRNRSLLNRQYAPDWESDCDFFNYFVVSSSP